RADDAHELAAVERLLLPDAVLFRHLVIGVGEQGEVQIELVRELLLARLIQDADAEDGGFALLELRQVVTKLTRFFRTAGGVVFRVKVKDDGTAGVIRQPVCFAVLVVEAERGSFLTFFNERHEDHYRRTSPREQLLARSGADVPRRDADGRRLRDRAGRRRPARARSHA